MVGTGVFIRLERTGELVKASLAREGTDEDRERWFADELRRDLRRRMTESDAHANEVASFVASCSGGTPPLPATIRDAFVGRGWYTSRQRR